MRGLAIIAVIVIHTTAQFTSFKPFTPTIAIAMSINALAHFAVPLFVFISGFALAFTYHSFNGYYLKRAKRILPAYVLFSLLYAVYFQKPIVTSLLNADAAYHLFFFKIIIGLYIISPGLLWIYERIRGEYFIIGAFLISSFYYRIPYAQFYIQDFVPYLSFLSYLFYFALGIYVCKNNAWVEMRLYSTNFMYLGLTALILWALVIAVWLRKFYGFDLPMIDWIARPFLYIVVIMLLLKLNLKSDSLFKLGDYAFGIYLVHLVPLTEAKRALLAHGIDFSNPMAYMLTFLFTLFVSYTMVFLWYQIRLKLATGAPIRAP